MEANTTEKESAVESSELEKFMKNLAEAVQNAENEAKRLISKVGDPSKGKPSKKLLSMTYESLFNLIQICSQVERCTMGHTQAIARLIDVRTRSIAKVLEKKGLLTKEELISEAETIMKEEEEEIERRKDETFEESLNQAKEEAKKRNDS